MIISKKLKFKLDFIFKVLIGKYKHVVYLVIDEDNFKSAVKKSFDMDGEIEIVQAGYFGMREIQYLMVIKAAAESITEGDLIAAEIENKINYENYKKA